jgi:hypothetical protein
MKTNYLNTDLVVDSHNDLQTLVDEFGDNVIVLYHGPFNDTYRAVFELTFDSAVDPEEVVNGFCELVENLSPQGRTVWDDSYKRVMDIGIESGDSPRPYTLELSSSALRRVSVLEGSLMISIYPTTESHELP